MSWYHRVRLVVEKNACNVCGGFRRCGKLIGKGRMRL